MPNIIEQQDLLKGLPDNRLAMLLQQPTGDIPPFLVAAEAQRRQAIRQQFAGKMDNESVVDNLTKQLAKVPQNIQAPMQAPPVIPQTPQMMGVAALQQQMAPQQMRAGGPVRRFAGAGFVAPGGIYGPAAENSREQIARTYMFLNPGMTYEEALQRAGIGAELPRPTVKDMAAAATGRDLSGMGGVGNYSVLRDGNSPPKDPAIQEAVTGTQEPQTEPATPPGMTAEQMRKRIEAIRRKPPVTEQAAPQEDGEDPEKTAEEDDIRAQIEALYAAQEPSDWEKAQRWFAMSEQFLDPSKTTMQSVAGAGRAFAEASGQMSAAQRQAEFEKQKMLLQYNIDERTRQRQIAAQGSTDKLESMKYQGEQYMEEAKIKDAEAKQAAKDLADYEEIMADKMAKPEEKAADPQYAALKTRLQQAIDAKNAALRNSQYYRYMYGSSYGTFGVPAFWDPNNPDAVQR